MASTSQKPNFTQLSERQIDRTYHPKGYGMSPSLQRARRPYFLRNALLGTTLFGFTLAVYFYSISAVQQDDFSDVEDLLPPLAERAQILSIEDEARASPAISPLPPSASSGSPSGDTSDSRGVWRALLPRRWGETKWLVDKGLVEGRTGNVIVWGAPAVEDFGQMRQSSGGSGEELREV